MYRKAISETMIGGKLVLITNRNSYNEVSIGNKIGDLERP